MASAERDGRATAIAGGGEEVVGEVGMTALRAVNRNRGLNVCLPALDFRGAYKFWSCDARYHITPQPHVNHVNRRLVIRARTRRALVPPNHNENL